MLKNIKLGAKMLGGFILVAIIVLVVGFFGWNGGNRLQKHIEEIGIVRLPGITNLQSLKIEANAMRIAVRTMLNPRLSKKDKLRQYDNITALRDRYQVAWDNYVSLPKNPEEEKLWQTFETAWEAWKNGNDQILTMAREIDTADILNPDDLKTRIVGFTRDHYALMEQTMELMLTGQTFQGGEDSTTCAFGHWLADYTTDNPRINALLTQVRAYHDPFHESVAEIKKLTAAGNTKAAQNLYISLMKPSAEQVFGIFRNLETEANRIVTLYNDMNELAMGDATNLQNQVMALLDQDIQLNKEIADESVETSLKDGRRVEIIAIIGMLSGVILALILGLILTRAITVPMAKGVDFARKIARGDLTVRLEIDQKDEIGVLAAAMKQMADKIKDIVGDVRNAADNVASGSRELSHSSVQMSTGATEQASSAEEVSSSIEEMGANIQQNSSNAVETEKIATKSAKDAQEGGAAVNEAVEAMKQIAEKINVIESIARETNMLSLNAAIEAARAGEHGKGFAVVASEVGKLAANSQRASVEIQKLAVASVEKANKAKEKIQAIVPDIQKTAELVVEIAASSAEQNSGAEQINQAMMQLDTVIQQNAATAEEASSMAEELTSQADQLLDLISYFKVDGDRTIRTELPSAVQKSGRTNFLPGTKKTPAIKQSVHNAENSGDSDGFEEF